MVTHATPVIYIAGPYRADSTWGIKRNIRAAEEVGIAVMHMGAMPLIPHMNTAHWDGLFPDEVFLAGTAALLLRCDAIVLCPGWNKSEGAKNELRLANMNDIPDFSWRWDKRKFERWVKRFVAEHSEVAA